jgi:hypothetical protein
VPKIWLTVGGVVNTDPQVEGTVAACASFSVNPILKKLDISIRQANPTNI